MDFTDTNVLYTSKINRHIVNLMKDILPEDGPILSVADKDGSIWSSDKDRLRQNLCDTELTARIISCIDDGNDPIIIEIETGVVAACQIYATKHNNRYLLYFMPDYTRESAIANMDLIETIFSLFDVIVDNIFQKQIDSENFKKHQIHWMPELSLK